MDDHRKIKGEANATAYNLAERGGRSLSFEADFWRNFIERELDYAEKNWHKSRRRPPVEPRSFPHSQDGMNVSGNESRCLFQLHAGRHLPQQQGELYEPPPKPPPWPEPAWILGVRLHYACISGLPFGLLLTHGRLSVSDRRPEAPEHVSSHTTAMRLAQPGRGYRPWAGHFDRAPAAPSGQAPHPHQRKED